MNRKELLEQIRSQLKLEDLIDLTDFKFIGHEYRGPHPIHGSSTGTNLSVNINTGQWYCFRCQSGGDALAWLAVQEGLVDCSEASDISHVFPEVLRIACERIGIENFQLSQDERKAWRLLRYEEQLLQSIFSGVVEFYRKHLDNHPEVKEWIKEKYGQYWNDKILQRFKIGYAPPDGDVLAKFLVGKYGEENALKSGLLKKFGSEIRDLFRGRVVFPYLKQRKPVYFIARATPWTPKGESKYLKQLKRNEKHEYVSQLVEEPIFGVDSIRGAREIIITEGVADAISAIAKGFPAISPATTRFKGDHVPELQKLVRGKTLYIVNDNEENDAGLKGALAILRKLEGDARLIILPKPGNVEKVDLNDYLRTHSPEDFRKLMEKAIPKEEAMLKFSDSIVDIFRIVLKEKAVDPDKTFGFWKIEKGTHGGRYEYMALEKVLPNQIREAIAIFRRDSVIVDGKKVKNLVEPLIRHSVIASVVLKYLRKEGKFLKDKSNRIYYFMENERRVYNVDENNKDFYALINEVSGLNPRTQDFKESIAEIISYALRNGEEVEVYRDFYLDKEKKTLYVYLQNGVYLRLDGQNVEIYPNGTNGIFFVKNPLVESLRYIPKTERREEIRIPAQIQELRDNRDLFIRAICNRTNFSPNEELSVRQQRDLLALYFYSVPFGDFLPVVPILVLIGEKGSSKTLTLRLFGRLLYGRNFDVSEITKQEDFAVALANWSFIALDNIDHFYDWLEDGLARVATRGIYRKRRLYTDSEEVYIPIKSFVALNSRDPKFRRDDVADRLLIIKTTRLERFVPEGVILRAVEEYRDEIFSVYVDDLNKIVQKLKEINIEELTTPHRLADWTAFALIAAEALDLDVEGVKDAIEKLDRVRAEFTLETDTFYLLLEKWVSERNDEQWIAARELYSELRDMAIIEGLDLYFKNHITLGQKLQNLKTELSRLLGMEAKYDSHGKRWLYKFPKNGRKEEYVKIKLDDGSIAQIPKTAWEKVQKKREEQKKGSDEEYLDFLEHFHFRRKSDLEEVLF